ncbi:MAG: hypothetical protein AB7G54_00600 [Methyloceanibacter sp.]
MYFYALGHHQAKVSNVSQYLREALSAPIILVTVGAVFAWMCAPIFNGWFLCVFGEKSDIGKLGQVGDLFGSVNAFFSAVAMVGAIYAVILQRIELRESRDANASQAAFDHVTSKLETIRQNREATSEVKQRTDELLQYVNFTKQIRRQYIEALKRRDSLRKEQLHRVSLIPSLCELAGRMENAVERFREFSRRADDEWSADENIYQCDKFCRTYSNDDWRDLVYPCFSQVVTDMSRVHGRLSDDLNSQLSLLEVDRDVLRFTAHFSDANAAREFLNSVFFELRDRGRRWTNEWMALKSQSDAYPGNEWKAVEKVKAEKSNCKAARLHYHRLAGLVRLARRRSLQLTRLEAFLTDNTPLSVQKYVNQDANHRKVDCY